MNSLDESQREFCQAPAGNIRLLAPAGCGKTLCLLYRCNHLAEQSSSKRQRFLIVTFTRAARDELQSRIDEDAAFAQIRDQAEVTTLNSWGYRRIRNAAFSPKLITSRTDYHFAMRNQLQPVWQRHNQIKSAIQNRNAWKSSQAPRNLMDMIDAFKSLGFDHVRHTSLAHFTNHWEELERQGLGWRLDQQVHQLIRFDVLDDIVGGKSSCSRQNEVFEAFFVFWREATEHLINSATFTLEDQKYFAYQDERTNIEKGRLLSGAASYDHVFVDEFQDINPLDLALVRAIVERSRATLTIAGDDDQAIFEWRGATPEYILDPSQFFNMQFDTYTLGVNYRSPANIVDHSQRLIAHNIRRVPKQISAHSANEAKIEILEIPSISESLDYVHSLVVSSIAQGEDPSRVALIGRKRSQIIPYQIYFASKDIPFCAAEDLQVFLSDTFERLLQLLTIKANADRRQSSRQVADGILFLCDLAKRYPLNKGNREELRSHLQRSRSNSIMEGIDALAGYRGELKGKNPGGQTSMEMADAIRAFIASESVSDALLSLSDNFEGLQTDFGKAEEDIFFTDPPFSQLAEYATRYGTDYDSFVDDIELAKETLVYVPPFEDGDSGDDLSKNPLHIMTALRAKGKEFDKVVLLDVQGGIWPNKNARTPNQLESERRVFYVGFTRAREQVSMLTHKVSGVSPYLEELALLWIQTFVGWMSRWLTMPRAQIEYLTVLLLFNTTYST